MTKKQELVKVAEKTQALAAYDFAEEIGSGFEEADADCYAIPYLSILQKNNPQCDPDSGAYLAEAKPGMFYNNVTGELLDGDEGVAVVPVLLQHVYVEWVPREQGGGFRGSFRPADPIVAEAKTHRDEKGRFLLPNGNHLIDTIYYYALVRTGQNWTPAVLSFTSTQLKKARAWNTTMQNFLLRRRDGTSGPAPMHARVYRISTRPESNDKGSWRGWKITTERDLHPASSAEDRELVDMARVFKSQIRDGSAQIVQTDVDPTGDATQDVSF